MSRLQPSPRHFAVLFAGLVGCLALAGLAAALIREQGKEERYAELRFKDESAVAAALTHAIFESSGTQGAAELSRRFGDRIVDQRALDRQARKQKLHYMAVLDERGRLLQASSTAPKEAIASLRTTPKHVRAVLRGATFAMTGVVRKSRSGIATMEYAATFPTRYGKRVILDGFDPVLVSSFVSGYLAQIPDHAYTDSYVIEESGFPIASSLRGRVSEKPTLEPAVRQAVSDNRRVFTREEGGRPQVLTSAPVRDTTWRVVSVTDRARLYARANGSAKTLGWLIFAALAAAVLGAIWLLVRLARNTGKLEAMNLELATHNQRLAHDALHDTLTGLPNRTLFRDRLEHALRRAQRTPESVCAVAFLDVDHFKLINDSLGHTVGDRLLIALAARLQTLLRPGDTVARLGGDEFTILLENVDGPQAAAAAIDRMTAGLSEPLSVDGRDHYVTVSSGIATGGPESAPEDLIRDADTAMYRAKRDGRARHAVFDPAMREQVVERAELQNGLRQALRRNEIEVAYQPILDLDTGKVAALEALARWRGADGRHIPPVDFIAVAEESGLIGALGRQVLHAACAQMVDWRARGVLEPGVKLWVNVSSRQFVADELVTDVSDVLAETSLPAESLCVELTETAFMDDPIGARATMDSLRRVGVRFHIDDFGTGYSSLGQLNSLSFEMLKIDRSFIARLEDIGDDNEVVSAIIGLAHSLGHRVVAEGVETENQLATLRTLGVDLAQGFLFARPLDHAATETLLTDDAGADAVTAAA